MAFCINCGQELAEGAKFCASCGNAVDAPQNGAKEQRKTVYDGELHKCTTKVKAETADYVGRLRIQREEGQYAMHKQTQSANIGAFRVEKQAEVGIAGAEALGHMGENGAGGVDLGNGSAGLNPAAMMAGMALGGAVSHNIAGIMNNSMAGINQTTPSGATPPPVPVVAYHIAVNGQATGPF